jgi:hypothetical protein
VDVATDLDNHIVYAPCGQRSIDDFIIISMCQAIAQGLAHAPRPSLHPILGLDRYVERIIVLRQISFRWDEKELGAIEVDKVHCWWKALVRGNAVSFDAIQHHDENHVITGYEWRRCQTRDDAMDEIRELTLVIVLPVAGFLAILDGSSKPDLIRLSRCTHIPW